MKIDTELDVTNLCYFLFKDSIHTGRVVRISIHVTELSRSITYRVQNDADGDFADVRPERIAISKLALLAKL